MTLSAFEATDSPTGARRIVVRTTYGPITNEVTEEVGYLRHFWGELGRLLDELEQPPTTPPA